jgi:hypothetical protein
MGKFQFQTGTSWRKFWGRKPNVDDYPKMALKWIP